MATITRRTRFVAGIALAASAALALTSCAADSSAGNGGDASSDAATATSLADFGTFEDLEAAAKAEGALNVIALPRDWANYGEILDLFAERYPEITINEASPDVSSQEEIDAAKTNEGLDTAPDVFDLGLTVALANTDVFAPYKVENFDEIPDALKEPTGLFVGDYGGYMSIGYDSSKFDEPTSLDDLNSADYKGAVAINGDPTQAGSAFAAVGLAAVQSGGDLDDFTPGIEYFGELQKAGNFLKVDVTPATITSGETPVVFDWDYLNAAAGADNDAWKVTVLDGVGYASYYNQAINKDAPHPAAARLWQEFLYSDDVQNLWLKGGARPARMEAMTEAGTIDAELAAALPEVPAETVVPTEEQSTAAGTLLGEKWAAAIQ
ncbi:ABC transporter substrate-binding protein [Microbacterium aerolatum]|uniref:ABC transporter substrate-binding protein n=1 Tax=Microbacterium aerolatum TaxID=153731 RepID=A0A511AE92_9MICO|nr:ABC transporter substrate-binding protein [Microbacterium aerolatum]MCK3770062.1 ABC transporter substrate-binding protein [Microbacterium aerolatum]GEK86336.1 ABC transporter substrate-binding protein [Microbacterium aerolatum]GGB17141.1 ABC transporter substrate-binding protein [Microbacterium aerolatum]